MIRYVGNHIFPIAPGTILLHPRLHPPKILGSDRFAIASVRMAGGLWQRLARLSRKMILLNPLAKIVSNVKSRLARVAQTVEHWFLHKFFVPEARQRLAGGEAQRSHESRHKIYTRLRMGDRPQAAVYRPSGAGMRGNRISGGYAALHRWLISSIPSGQHASPRVM